MGTLGLDFLPYIFLPQCWSAESAEGCVPQLRLVLRYWHLPTRKRPTPARPRVPMAPLPAAKKTIE